MSCWCAVTSDARAGYEVSDDENPSGNDAPNPRKSGWSASAVGGGIRPVGPLGVHKFEVGERLWRSAAGDSGCPWRLFALDDGGGVMHPARGVASPSELIGAKLVPSRESSAKAAPPAGR